MTLDQFNKEIDIRIGEHIPQMLLNIQKIWDMRAHIMNGQHLELLRFCPCRYHELERERVGLIAIRRAWDYADLEDHDYIPYADGPTRVLLLRHADARLHEINVEQQRLIYLGKYVDYVQEPQLPS